MPFFSATAKNNHDLAHGLAQFTGLTQIKTLFYSFTGVLIQDDTVATDVTTNQHQPTTLSLTTTALFPVGIDHCLWGVILCDTTNVSAQQLRFARTYLIDTLRQVFAEHANDTIQVWAALDSTQLNQISHFYQLLVHANVATTTKSSLVPLNTPLINDDAYRSMNQALHFIHDHIHQSLSLDEVAKVAYLSPSYLSRLFKKYLQTNFVSYVNTQKITLAQKQLATTLIPIHQIATQLGFSQTSYFTKVFKQTLGITPSQFRQQNRISQINQLVSQNTWAAESSHMAINHPTDHWVYTVSGRFTSTPTD